LVSALILQHRYRLTYEKLFDSIKFNLLTKIALGLQTLDEVPFSEASIFNFQNNLNSYFIETGINLLERVFDHLTEKQLKELKIKTDIQRTDCFQAASNSKKIQPPSTISVNAYQNTQSTDRERQKAIWGTLCAICKENIRTIYLPARNRRYTILEIIGKVYKEINDKLKPKYESIDGGIDIFKIF